MPNVPNNFVENIIQKYKQLHSTRSIDLETIDYLKKVLHERVKLIQQLNDDLYALPKDQIFKAVEIGCGSKVLMFLVTQELADYHQKQIKYIGIDIDGEGIKYLQSLTQSFNTVTYINADASDSSWINQVGVRSFNAVIFINPIVEDPIEAALEYSFNTREKVEKNPRFQIIFKQYQQFQKIFKEILPMCLAPKASLLIKTFNPHEYLALFPLLAPMTISLPKSQKIPEDQCLVAQFGTPEKKSEANVANNFARFFTVRNVITSAALVTAVGVTAYSYFNNQS